MWNKVVLTACLVSALAAVPFVWGEGLSVTQGADRRHRVVMHLNSGDTQVQKGVLNNIKHLYEGLGGDHVTVELVVHGPGLELFMKKGTKFWKELEQFHRLYGVSYTACSNTNAMKAMSVTKVDLIGQVARAIQAIVRLVELEEAGWA